jgi:hypothetical protein
LKLMLKEILVIEVPTMRSSCARSQKLRYNIAWVSARQSTESNPSLPVRENIQHISAEFRFRLIMARRKRKFYASCGKISRRRNRLIERNAYGTSFKKKTTDGVHYFMHQNPGQLQLAKDLTTK